MLVGAVAAPAPAGAATTTSTDTAMESIVRTLMNRDRAARGLKPLRFDLRLADFAGERASWMAATARLTHNSVDGTACQGFQKRAIRWYRCGENIGWTTAAWGARAARNLYSLWKHSPVHWSLMMSPRFNYVGVGFAYRSSSRQTFGSIVFLEGPDRTAPVAKATRRSAINTTIRFSWTDRDPRLQTHTSGVRDINLGYQVDDGPITVIRSRTTAHSITLPSRARGHTYTLWVQARDRAGNLSGWTIGYKVTIP
jgi:uncharacterized protein YkwD